MNEVVKELNKIFNDYGLVETFRYNEHNYWIVKNKWIYGEMFRLFDNSDYLKDSLVVFNKLEHGTRIDWLYVFEATDSMKKKGFNNNVWSFEQIKKDGYVEVRNIIEEGIKQYKRKMEEIKFNRMKEDFV